MQELIGLCDRVMVMREGRITGQVAGQNINERAIVRLAMGLTEAQSAPRREDA